jgi:hypothetical protein
MGQEDREKGKGGLQKYRFMKSYKKNNDDTQFKVPKRVEEDKKVKHSQVFGKHTLKRPKDGGKSRRGKRR